MLIWLATAGAAAFDYAHRNAPELLVDFLLTALLAHPLYTYVSYVWEQKAEEISASLPNLAKQKYLDVFQKISVTVADAAARFDLYYRKWYGRRRLICPIILVLLVAVVENFVLAQSLVKLNSSSTTIDVLSAAIAGAYTFVTWNFFSLVQQRSLLIVDIMRGALRLAIAIPIGFALGGLSTGGGPFLAFAVGVFPLDTISTILRQLANKQLKLELGPARGPSQISQLSGVDAAIADRLEEANVTTIPQLAWCDPIDLTMRTNLRFAYVIDIVSQALCWVYLETKTPALRPYGLRGAFEITSFVHDLKSEDAAEKARAERVLASAATAAGVTTDGLYNAFEEIEGDPSTQFLFEAG